MKYKVGDKVRIKSLDWYNENKDIYGMVNCPPYVFYAIMCHHCGTICTINIVDNFDKKYKMKEDGCNFDWTDEMIEGLMEEETKVGTALNPIELKSNANCLTRERVDELAIKIDKELPYGNQNVWELPEGYQFTDENGNVINATKIVLEKKKPKYPQTYEECLKVLGFNTTIKVKESSVFDYDDDIVALQKLKRCRDAYWKIAGQEMELGKPWKPDWHDEEYRDMYYISYDGRYIDKETGFPCVNMILIFPTEEMRDAFYENFKGLIEECKELL